MTCYENSEGEKNENGGEENKQESKNPEDDERKVDPRTARNSEEPQGTPLTQLYVSAPSGPKYLQQFRSHKKSS